MFGGLALAARINAAAHVIAAVAIVAAAGSVITAAPAQAQTIVVQGNRRVDADTIRSYFILRPGERLDAVKIDQAYTALYGTGLFREVRITPSGGRILVVVVENPVINRVVFRGAKRVKTEQLASEVESKPRSPYSPTTVQSDIQRITDIYRRVGRFDVRIEPRVEEVANGRVDLVYEITEGDKTGVYEIRFVGNNAFSNRKLKDVMTIGETNFLSFIRSNDIYDPDRLAADQELLRRFYLRAGYADFRVVSAVAELDGGNRGYIITITVEEGERYSFGSVEVQSNIRDVDPATLRTVLRTRQGAVYNAELIDKTIEDITIELSKRGYAFAQVRPRGDRDYANRIVSVVYVVDEGPRVYVERINVRGNLRTRDYVVRREFDLAEGDAYNRVLIDRAERRLKNLGFFKTVRITNEQGSAPDRVIINVDVEDQSTGEFSVAGGYSTADGVIGEISIGEKNFLGRGQYVKLTGTYGQRTRGVEFSFTEPYFLGYRLSAGFDVFYKKIDQSNFAAYNQELVGGTIRFGIPLRDDFAIQTRYSIYQQKIEVPAAFKDCTTVGPDPVLGSFTDITNPLAGCYANGEASLAIRQAEGSRVVSLVGYSLIYNSLDSTFNPTRGILAEFRQDFAGVGGDAHFLRTTVDGRYYHELGWDFVGILRGQAGHVVNLGSGDLRIFDHFFKGPELVRGFQTAGIGPRDFTLGVFGDALGGTTFFGGSAEVQVPLSFLPKEVGIKAAAFIDVGTLFDYNGQRTFLVGTAPGAPFAINVIDDSGLRAAAGVGFLWQSPLGPIRFDFAWPIMKQDGDRTQVFRFSGGTKF